ncbi:uncharacterized protein TNCV_1314451 [Trichonephila clavipes]|nr:uncharacterized protein TNCV_1314451 [Trichonephila clavipes]
MSLPNPVEQKSYDVINNKLSRVMKEVAEESMKSAAVEENSSSPDNLLMVSGDGTWKTRGHSSLIGKLSDGKTIGGKGRLTDSLIDKLAHYYGNAIRCNSTSVKEIRKAIWAVWGHSCSTDDEPVHWFCPTNQIHGPVFADLSHPTLLKKCLGKKFGLKINRNVCVSLAERDNRRIFTSRQRRLESSFEARRVKKIKKSKEIELFQEQEGISYDPGAFLAFPPCEERVYQLVDNIPVNLAMYVARDGTEWILHNRFATGKVLRQSSGARSFAELLNGKFLADNLNDRFEQCSNHPALIITYCARQWRSYHRISRINDMGRPNYRSPNVFNFIPTNRVLIPKESSVGILIQSPLRASYASDW